MTTEMPTMKRPIAVLGDGWAATAALAGAVRLGVPLIWIPASGERLAPILPALPAGEGVSLLEAIARGLGIEVGEVRVGCFVREARNKAFREPVWLEEGLPEGAESRIAALEEARFENDLFTLDSEIRSRLMEHPLIRRIEGKLVIGVDVDGDFPRLKLSGGDEIECAEVVWADRWSDLRGVEGIPSSLNFAEGKVRSGDINRKLKPVGVLQVEFKHQSPIGIGVAEGFVGICHREAGEKVDRRVWGYFTEDGRQSVWSLVLHSDETEDNHQIAKKLRRMKQVLNRTFLGDTWLPSGCEDFMSNVAEEHVRFQDQMLYSSGEESSELVADGGIVFLTDGFGIGSALRMVDLWLSRRANAEAKGVDHPGSTANAEFVGDTR